MSIDILYLLVEKVSLVKILLKKGRRRRIRVYFSVPVSRNRKMGSFSTGIGYLRLGMVKMAPSGGCGDSGVSEAGSCAISVVMS